MVRYECDFCGRLKESGEAWILGFAAEAVGVTAARREITIAPQWDESKAVDYLAVHFCSEECRQKYMAQLFGAESPKTKVVEEVAVLPRERLVVREYPETRVETTVTSKNRPAKTIHRRRRA